MPHEERRVGCRRDVGLYNMCVRAQQAQVPAIGELHAVPVPSAAARRAASQGRGRQKHRQRRQVHPGDGLQRKMQQLLLSRGRVTALHEEGLPHLRSGAEAAEAPRAAAQDGAIADTPTAVSTHDDKQATEREAAGRIEDKGSNLSTSSGFSRTQDDSHPNVGDTTTDGVMSISESLRNAFVFITNRQSYSKQVNDGNNLPKSSKISEYQMIQDENKDKQDETKANIRDGDSLLAISEADAFANLKNQRSKTNHAKEEVTYQPETTKGILKTEVPVISHSSDESDPFKDEQDDLPPLSL